MSRTPLGQPSARSPFGSGSQSNLKRVKEEPTPRGLAMVAIPARTPFQGSSRQGKGQAFGSDGPDAGEVTMIPIVPPAPPARSRIPLLVGFLAVCLVLWGVSVWKEQRRASLRLAGNEAMVQDADYYDLAVGSLVHDTQVQFKHWKPPVSREKLRDGLLDRERQIRLELPAAKMTEQHRGALSEALDDVVSFVKAQPMDTPTDQPAAVVAHDAEGEGNTVAAVAPAPAPAPKPIDFSLLKHANGLLGTLPQ